MELRFVFRKRQKTSNDHHVRGSRLSNPESETHYTNQNALSFKATDKAVDPNIYTIKSLKDGRKGAKGKRGFSDAFLPNKVSKELQLLP